MRSWGRAGGGHLESPVGNYSFWTVSEERQGERARCKWKVYTSRVKRITAVEVLNLALYFPCSICLLRFHWGRNWEGGANLFSTNAPFSCFSSLINPPGPCACSAQESVFRSASTESLSQAQIISDSFFTFRCFLWRGKKIGTVYVDPGQFLNAEESKVMTSWLYSVTEDLRLSLLFHPG